QFEIAEVPVTQRVVETEAGGQGGLQGRLNVSADVVLQQRHSGETGQPDAGRTVAPGGRKTHVLGVTQIPPVARLSGEQAALVGDAAMASGLKALLSGASKEFQEGPRHAGRTVREAGH